MDTARSYRRKITTKNRATITKINLFNLRKTFNKAQ